MVRRIIFIIFALIASAVLSGTALSTPVLKISDGNISGVGGFTTVNLTLSEVPDGLAGYNITVSLSNTSVAEIISVELPDWTNITNTSSLPADLVQLKAVDWLNNVRNGSGEVLLAKLTIRGDANGSTYLNAGIGGLDDDRGDNISTNIVPGLLNVGIQKIKFTLSLTAGWNMISLPIIPDNSSVNVIFGKISTLNIRPVVKWQSPLFIKVDKIEPKKGYWVFTPQTMDIVINGTHIKETNLSLTIGWNMIGTIGLENLSLLLIPNQVPQRPPVKWQSPIFVPINELVSGKAAWVFVTRSTEITI